MHGPETNHGSALVRAVDRAQTFLLCLLAFALPWEVHQRIPFTGLTVIKVCGPLLIIMALVRSLVLDKVRPPAPPAAAGRIHRTGLRGPLILFVAAMAISTLVSFDQPASLAMVRLYALYLLLFIAVMLSARDVEAASRTLWCYAISSVGVAALTFACYAGLLLPTYWRPSVYPWTKRLILEAEAGTLMRMVAASPDLNQGALALLVGFAILLFLPNYSARRGGRGGRARQRVLLHAAQLALVGAIAIAQSRSALIAAAGLCAAATAWRLRGRVARPALYGIGAGVALILAALVWYLFTYKLPREEDSVASRMVAYRAALELLPRHAWLGTGLDASDRMIASTEWGAKVRGATIHSVPFKLLLETGIAGFVAFLWCGAAAVRRVWIVLLRSDAAVARRLGAAALAVGFSVLALALVQPFMALPLYPIAFGAIFGPIAFAAPLSARPTQAWGNRPTVLAALLAGALVLCNVTLYQLGAPRVIRFANALERGPAAEREGRWHDAADAYRESLGIARAATESATGNVLETWNMANLPGFDALARVIDMERIYDNMAIGLESPNPQSAAALGLGRTLAARGDLESAERQLREAATIEPSFADAHLELAELDWRAGRWAEAIDEYANAARAEQDWRNLRYREQMGRLDARIRLLSSMPLVNAGLERARLLRKRGRWSEAATLYREIEQEFPDSAEALFGLGVDAIVNGRPDVAARYFERALVICPTHAEARTGLDVLRAP